MTYEIKLQVGSQHVLRDHLRKATGLLAPGTDARHTLEEALAQIEEQLPAVEEPTEFGSIVRATSGKLFVLADTTGDDDMRWCGQEGLWVRFANLGAVEVLRAHYQARQQHSCHPLRPRRRRLHRVASVEHSRKRLCGRPLLRSPEQHAG